MIPAPTPAQLGNADLDSWRVVPGEDNPDKLDCGTWSVAGGEEFLDFDIAVSRCDTSRQIAEFVLEAVQQHARKLWAEGAMADVLDARQQLGEPDHALFSWGTVCDLMQQVAAISAIHQERLIEACSNRSDRDQRLYPLYASLAATLLMHMEKIRSDASNYGGAA